MTEIQPRRLDRRTKLARRSRQLEKAFTAELGGNLSEARLAAVRRAAELFAIAERVRSRWMAGDLAVSGTDIVRMEGTARRALIDLNLPASSGVRPGESFDDIMARAAMGDEDEDDVRDDDDGADQNEVPL
jgi:hypothetical protein